MHLNTISVFILALAATSQGFTIPDNQPNGVYKVSVDANGVETHTLLRGLIENYTYVSTEPNKPLPTLHATSAKFRRQDLTGQNNIACGGYSLVTSDVVSAVGNLEAQCGNGAFVGGGKNFYSITGGTVAYFCNFSGGTNNCYASEMVEAAERITNDCGSSNGGWDIVPDRQCQYGYERQPGNHFCGRGTDSSRGYGDSADLNFGVYSLEDSTLCGYEFWRLLPS
ncbi:hypothetical protein G7Y89_g15075 [Cudoniella acicularis]|uniref:Secreted protein n=1 Tax=Cudoniella acicularis TaxID=354080 RepID=A0A8H4QTI3_9HELO|nr:hypothetical protein G7Y89_g15075 [Cudoniella acicularis]